MLGELMWWVGMEWPCIIFYFMQATWKYLLLELRSRCMKSLKNKQITHVQKCILTFGSLFIADNILKAAIVTVSS